jgi:DNA-binding protein HU-beta
MAMTTAEKKTIKDAIVLIERETNSDGDALMLRGFGSFTRKQVAAKTARNPQTGGEVNVPARSVLRFSASKSTRRDL